MTLRILVLLLAICANAQVQKVGYDANRDYTLLFYSVKNIDTVKIPGNWERDKRDLATSVYLEGPNGRIGFYIDTKSKKYAQAASEAEALQLYASDKIKKIKRSWDVELLDSDKATYQLYKIKDARHPDGNQVALLGTRGRYVFSIVCYGEMADAQKSEFLINLFKKATP